MVYPKIFLFEDLLSARVHFYLNQFWTEGKTWNVVKQS